MCIRDRLSLSYTVAAAGSLLFAFLPYHLFRGEVHLLLSGIYIIPLASLAILRVCAGTPPFIKLDEVGKATYDFSSRRAFGYALISVLTASAGIYYAIFACFFLAVAGLYAAIDRKSLMRLAAAGIVIGLIIIGLIVNLSPNIINNHRYGKNPEVAGRLTIETEILGTTSTQLVLPATSHRVDFLANLKAEYMQGATLVNGSKAYVNENDWSSLGAIGSLGFLFLLAWLIFARGRYGDDDSQFFTMLNGLGILNITAILLATIGGFGLLFSIVISSQIRAYNRISIYIGFFSIMAVLLLLERWRQKYMKNGDRPMIFIGIIMVVAAAGIVDQTNDTMVPDYMTIAKAYNSDQAFVQSIESQMPAQAMVFQLPYAPFPENPPVNAMLDYNHLRAYLHSRTVHWSYGTMKGRNDDLWQRSVSSEPTDQFLKDIIAAGFNGIWINRAGYADGAAQIERQLEDELEVKPMLNDDNTLLFFNMKDYIDKLNSTR